MENKFQRILIASDLTEMDQNLFNFTKEIAQLSDPQHLYLVHIVPDFSNPQNTELKFHKSFATGYPVDEKARDILTERANDHFKDENFKVSIEVIEGNIYQKLMHWIDVKEIDLIVVGRKKIKNGSGIVPRRIARKVNCNVLFITEEIEDKITSISVPVDFSPNSLSALQRALRFKKESTIPVSITALHIVNLLPSDYYFGLEYNQDYREALRIEKEKYFTDFLINNGIEITDVRMDLVLNNYQNISLQIRDYLADHPTDLVVIGATGHSALQNLMYGSVTERFVEIYAEAPILIVR